jgi:hypothetical protein
MFRGIIKPYNSVTSRVAIVPCALLKKLGRFDTDLCCQKQKQNESTVAYKQPILKPSTAKQGGFCPKHACTVVTQCKKLISKNVIISKTVRGNYKIPTDLNSSCYWQSTPKN